MYAGDNRGDKEPSAIGQALEPPPKRRYPPFRRRASLRRDEGSCPDIQSEIEIPDSGAHGSGQLEEAGAAVPDEDIPPHPEKEPVFEALESLENVTCIVVDLIRDSNARHAKMTEFSAVTLNAADTFTRRIQTTNRPWENENQEELPPSDEVMRDFMDWAAQYSPYCLLAHNAKVVHYRTILQSIDAAGLKEPFDQICVGFLDTMPLLKDVQSEEASYALDALCKSVTGKDGSTMQTAEQRASALKEVLVASGCTSKQSKELLRQAFTTSSAWARMQYLERNAELLRTLTPLVQSGSVSSQMAKKIANSGLKYAHLSQVYQREGPRGLKCLLMEEVPGTGKPRVTATARILDEICRHFQAQFPSLHPEPVATGNIEQPAS